MCEVGTGGRGAGCSMAREMVLVLLSFRLYLGVCGAPRLSEWGQLPDFPGNVGTFDLFGVPGRVVVVALVELGAPVVGPAGIDLLLTPAFVVRLWPLMEL